MADQLDGARSRPAARSQTDISRPFIVGGSEAPDGRWPFHVGLLLKGVGDRYESQYCSGVLVAPNYVITVAHCVDFLNDRRQVLVLVGTQDLRSGGSRRSVRRIIIHPDYNPNTFDSDLAVLELSSSVDKDTAKLAGPGQEARFATAGKRAFITGWGDTDPDHPEVDCCFPSKLHEALTRIQQQNDCNDADSYHGQITANMICAGHDPGGPGACLLDAGGPLTVRNSRGDYVLVAGLAAATGDHDCGEPEEFTVFTRISKFKAWINDIIEP